MAKIAMKWAWNPEDIGGRRLILVQVDRTERNNWQCLTDAIQALSKYTIVERVKRTPNDYVHALKFTNDPVLATLESCQSYIETIYEAKCEAADVDPSLLKWQLSEPVEDRLVPKPKERPATLAQLLETSAAKQLDKIKNNMLKQAVAKLDQAIERDEITDGEAYQLLKMVLTGTT